MTHQAHPAIDALEARLQTNVTLSSRYLNGKRKFVVEAHSHRTSYGNTPAQAIGRFLYNNKLEREPSHEDRCVAAYVAEGLGEI